MKKLNRKGFTLIELLAIIVILAIIMVVTIPTVLSTMGNATSEMLQNSANSVAEWVEKEYSLALIGSADKEFIDLCGSNGSLCAENSALEIPLTGDKATVGKSFLATAGVVASNYQKATVQIMSSGRACVTLQASANGDFKNIKETVEGVEVLKTVKSSICS